MINSITFTDNKPTKIFILNALKKGCDSEGYIIDRKTKKRILDAVDRREILLSEFGGVMRLPGRKRNLYIRNNIVSLISLLEKYPDIKKIIKTRH